MKAGIVGLWARGKESGSERKNWGEGDRSTRTAHKECGVCGGDASVKKSGTINREKRKRLGKTKKEANHTPGERFRGGEEGPRPKKKGGGKTLIAGKTLANGGLDIDGNLERGLVRNGMFRRRRFSKGGGGAQRREGRATGAQGQGLFAG